MNTENLNDEFKNKCVVEALNYKRNIERLNSKRSKYNQINEKLYEIYNRLASKWGFASMNEQEMESRITQLREEGKIVINAKEQFELSHDSIKQSLQETLPEKRLNKEFFRNLR